MYSDTSNTLFEYISQAYTQPIVPPTYPPSIATHTYIQSETAPSYEQHLMEYEPHGSQLLTPADEHTPGFAERVHAMENALNNLITEVTKRNKAVDNIYEYITECKKTNVFAAEVDDASFGKIGDFSSMQTFEKQLENDTLKNKLRTQFVREIGSNRGTGIGRDKAAYDLVDKMFTRDFFTHFTWTGTSSSNITKHAFRDFGGTIHFFLGDNQ